MSKLFGCVCGDRIGCHERDQEAVCKHRRVCGCTGFRPEGLSDRIRYAMANWLWPQSWLPQWRLFVNEVFILLLLIVLFLGGYLLWM